MVKTIDYTAYLLSKGWKEKRRKQLKHQKKCQSCGAEKRLHAHHMTYERVGGKEKLKDLQTLCEICHKELHAKFILHRQKNGFKHHDLLRFTKRFCRAKRKKIMADGVYRPGWYKNSIANR